MTDTDGDPVGATRLDPEDAFALVANDTRFAVLQALWEADDPALPFSALRERVGMRDSGQFNYHLNKLTGPFVRKTDDGYELTYAGQRVVGSVLSGVYTRDVSIEPIPIDATCRECGGAMQATYEDGRVRIRCADCETAIVQYSAPAGILEGRSREDLPDAFSQWVQRLVDETRAGFCRVCMGVTEPHLGPPDDPDFDDEETMVHYTCERCGDTVTMSAATTLLDHPAVVRLHDDHGVDLRTAPLWDVEWLFDDVAERLSDPDRIRVTVAVGDDDVTLDLDEELTATVVEGPESVAK